MFARGTSVVFDDEPVTVTYATGISASPTANAIGPVDLFCSDRRIAKWPKLSAACWCSPDRYRGNPAGEPGRIGHRERRSDKNRVCRRTRQVSPPWRSRGWIDRVRVLMIIMMQAFLPGIRQLTVRVLRVRDGGRQVLCRVRWSSILCRRWGRDGERRRRVVDGNHEPRGVVAGASSVTVSLRRTGRHTRRGGERGMMGLAALVEGE